MSGVPTWLGNNSIVISRTMNGYSVSESSTSVPSQILAFETWEALTYYLTGNYANPPQSA